MSFHRHRCASEAGNKSFACLEPHRATPTPPRRARPAEIVSPHLQHPQPPPAPLGFQSRTIEPGPFKTYSDPARALIEGLQRPHPYLGGGRGARLPHPNSVAAPGERTAA